MSLTNVLLLVVSGAIAWFAIGSTGDFEQPRPLEAATASYLDDSDGDFLPDVVEWAVFTRGDTADTDSDFTEDFVEVVQFGEPTRANSQALPQDHEFRTVVTLERAGHGEFVWCHFLFRVMGGGPNQIPITFDPWIEVQGLRIPFGLGVGSPMVEVRQRAHPTEGHWAIVSARLASRQAFSAVGTCVFGADATIGTTNLRVGTYVTETASGDMVHLVPKRQDFALQSTAPRQIQDELDPFFRSNKLCVLDLEFVGQSPVGSIFETANPRCEEASGLDCAAECPRSDGWTITLPDGIGPLTGQ